MLLATVGGGAIVLRGLRIETAISSLQTLGFAFFCGVGMLGWNVFFIGTLGYLNTTALISLLCVMSTGLYFIDWPAFKRIKLQRPSLWTYILLGLLVIVLSFDIAEALSPVADADTLAYHFETPRQFLERGEIFAITRAYDGAIPLLLHMTYTVALAIGGEGALTLWVMLTGWGLGLAMYVVVSHFASRNWALVGTLLILTTPAIVYAAGTGQIEPRTAAFALLAVFAFTNIGNDNKTPFRWVLLAGLFAGFFAAAKITGLIFVFAVGVAVLLKKDGLRYAVVYSCAAIAAGFQWYVYNWTQTGDPLYPLLWQFMSLNPGFEWNAEVAESARLMLQQENSLPRDFLWFVTYPLRTIISPLPIFESLRTGLGPATLLGLPFALILLFQRKSTALCSSTVTFGVTAFMFYSIWFFFGPSVRIRHLVPIYPIVLCLIILACAKFTQIHGAKGLLLTGFLGVIVLQLGGQAIFTKKYIDRIIQGQSNDAFLSKNIAGYGVVEWINKNLNPDDRILITSREWLFRLKVPYLLASPGLQTTVSLNLGNQDLSRFVRQLNDAQISNIVLLRENSDAQTPSTLGRFVGDLKALDCIYPLAFIEGERFQSRTLKAMKHGTVYWDIYRYDSTECDQRL